MATRMQVPDVVYTFRPSFPRNPVCPPFEGSPTNPRRRCHPALSTPRRNAPLYAFTLAVIACCLDGPGWPIDAFLIGGTIVLIAIILEPDVLRNRTPKDDITPAARKAADLYAKEGHEMMPPEDRYEPGIRTAFLHGYMKGEYNGIKHVEQQEEERRERLRKLQEEIDSTPATIAGPPLLPRRDSRYIDGAGDLLDRPRRGFLSRLFGFGGEYSQPVAEPPYFDDKPYYGGGGEFEGGEAMDAGVGVDRRLRASGASPEPYEPGMPGPSRLAEDTYMRENQRYGPEFGPGDEYRRRHAPRRVDGPEYMDEPMPTDEPRWPDEERVRAEEGEFREGPARPRHEKQL